MTNQHRATPEQWANMKEYQDDGLDDGYGSCIIELRARIESLEVAQLEQAESNRFCTDAIVRRVEALEAAQQDKLDRLIAMDAADPTPDSAMTELRAASAEVRPAGLVERVAMAANCYPHENARAAIREVAKWLRDRYPKSPEAGAVAFNLCQEADRG